MDEVVVKLLYKSFSKGDIMMKWVKFEKWSLRILALAVLVNYSHDYYLEMKSCRWLDHLCDSSVEDIGREWIRTHEPDALEEIDGLIGSTEGYIFNPYSLNPKLLSLMDTLEDVRKQKRRYDANKDYIMKSFDEHRFVLTDSEKEHIMEYLENNVRTDVER